MLRPDRLEIRSDEGNARQCHDGSERDMPLISFLIRVARNLLKPASEVNFTGRFDNARYAMGQITRCVHHTIRANAE